MTLYTNPYAEAEELLREMREATREHSRVGNSSDGTRSVFLIPTYTGCSPAAMSLLTMAFNIACPDTLVGSNGKDMVVALKGEHAKLPEKQIHLALAQTRIILMDSLRNLPGDAYTLEKNPRKYPGLKYVDIDGVLTSLFIDYCEKHSDTEKGPKPQIQTIYKIGTQLVYNGQKASKITITDAQGLRLYREQVAAETGLDAPEEYFFEHRFIINDVAVKAIQHSLGTAMTTGRHH